MAKLEYFSADEVVDLLRQVKGGRGLLELAGEIERKTGTSITPQFVSQILLGTRNPGQQVLDYLNFEKRTVYVKKNSQ